MDFRLFFGVESLYLPLSIIGFGKKYQDKKTNKRSLFILSNEVKQYIVNIVDTR